MKRVVGWDDLAAEAVVAGGAPGSVLTLGVFDGLHRGHVRLLAAAERLARAAGLQRVHIGFTPHPDLLIRGAAPLLLLDPGELELRMAGAGVDLWCDLPFTPETRDTPWERFIERLVEVMEERYRLFEKAQVSDIREYNESVEGEARLERKVVVIDEFQDLTAEKASAKPFFAGVKRLGAKARAAGVHLILATQRPDREVVPGLLRTNLGGKIALRVATAINSRIILDEAGAERLHGKGDLLANLGNGTIRAQAPMVE
jgi:S-DNA-T family DNA segregation ATPase FtsK/SpoIIIE